MTTSRLAVLLFSLCAIFAVFVEARRGHLEPLGNSGTMEPLHERVGFINPKDFLTDYVLKNRPVLMRKAILDSPAIHKWSDEYLMAKAKANPEVMISLEYGKKETRLNGSNMAFADYLNIYNTSDVYMVNGMPPYLEEDMVIPWSLQCEDYKRSFEDNVMWFSSGGTKSVIHHDGYENINCLIRGKKRFLFVNTTKYAHVERKIIDYLENGSYGSVDVERVDLDKYPVYEGMQFFEANLNPGDCVYSPYLWIHQVESWNSNIAVNMWWFRDINALIDPALCSPTFDLSKTFKTVSFHKTTILEDGADMEGKVFAFIHSVARLVFKTTKKDSVNVKEFVKVMVNGKKAPRDLAMIVIDMFRVMDTNRNKKFEIKDLDKELTDEAMEGFYSTVVQWLSHARIHKFALPVDLRDNSYKSVTAFKAEELTQGSAEDSGRVLESKEGTSGRGAEKMPVLQEVDAASLGDRDEL